MRKGKTKENLKKEKEFDKLPDLLTVKAVAEIFDIDTRTVRKMIKCGTIKKQEVINLTGRGCTRIYKTAIWRILHPTPKTFPKQAHVYHATPEQAARWAQFAEEDKALGLDKAYAPVVVDAVPRRGVEHF